MFMTELQVTSDFRMNITPTFTQTSSCVFCDKWLLHGCFSTLWSILLSAQQACTNEMNVLLSVTFIIIFNHITFVLVTFTLTFCPFYLIHVVKFTEGALTVWQVVGLSVMCDIVTSAKYCRKHFVRGSESPRGSRTHLVPNSSP